MDTTRNTTYFSATPALLWLASFTLLLWYGFSIAQAHHQGLFFIAAAAAQSALLSLPAWILCRSVQLPRPGGALARALVVLLHSYALVTLCFIYVNYRIYGLYGFYFNGFVWNILTTPGGIEALGVTPSFYVSGVVRLLAAVLLYFGLSHLFRRLPRLMPGRAFAALIALLFTAQAATYAYADYTRQRDILLTAEAIPWYPGVTARHFLERLGLKQIPAEPTLGRRELRVGKLDYPAHDLDQISLHQRYNIVWLVAESWRADMLSERVMPATHAFAEDNLRFLDHYSGGNGTRMGMFTQFYGLYGNYWFDVLDARQPPLLLSLLRRTGYRMKAFTSAKFSYPEFDQTIFAEFSSDELQSYAVGQGWQRDRKNVTDLISYMDEASAPFFAFMFFESPHANYHFPPESVIEPDYLKDFNYLETDIKQQITGIKARYINACAHLDSQIARVLEALQKQGRLKDTIVVITGDHGEEFMENGRWGHNSTFSEQQIKVPLILHVPGKLRRRVTAMTSHLDLPTTLLSILAEPASVESDRVGFGQNLLEVNPARNYIVVSDWHGNALITQHLKLVLSPKAVDERGRYFSRTDQPLVGDNVAGAASQLIQQFLADNPRFYRLRTTL